MQYQFDEVMKKVDSVLKIIEMEGIEEKEQLLTKLKTCQECERIAIILRDYPIYRSDVKRRDFLFEHQDNIYLKQIARLLRSNSVFYDKTFVNNLILKTENNQFIWEKFLTIDELSSIIERKYSDTFDNALLNMALDISSSVDSLKFARLLSVNYFMENPLWLLYFKKWCDEEKQTSTAGVMKNVDVDKFLLLEENNKMNEHQEKLLEIDGSNKTDKEKVQAFSKLVKDIIDMDIDKKQGHQKRIGIR